MDRLALVTLPIDRNANKYSERSLTAYGFFQILKVIEHSLAVDEEGITNTISIDLVTLVGGSIRHSRRLEPTKIFLEDETTFHEARSYTKKRNTFPWHEHYYME